MRTTRFASGKTFATLWTGTTTVPWPDRTIKISQLPLGPSKTSSIVPIGPSHDSRVYPRLLSKYRIEFEIEFLPTHRKAF